MEHHNFSTNIAFIPWNRSRSSPVVAALFRQNPEKLSLSIHGCDHGAAEFGTRDQDLLSWKAQQAMERMCAHEVQTGIRHDRIMVFPQGVFSKAAPRVLQHKGFVAAVNTEVIAADPEPRKIKLSSLWDVAVMEYGGFPIFTRRYPSQGIENFAFDIVLGKPCLIVIHHDFCRDRYARLVEFITHVNALNCTVSWRSLGEVIRRSFRQKQTATGVIEVEMYATELYVENRTREPKRFEIRRRVLAPDMVKALKVNDVELAWRHSAGYVHFRLELNPMESAAAIMTFNDCGTNGRHYDSLADQAKTRLRRYLCEARDNYLTKYKPSFFCY
jgi:hypothetical protein